MPQAHMAPELRPVSGAEHVRLVASPPARWAWWALRVLLIAGPVVAVALFVASWHFGGCLLDGLFWVLLIVLIVVWGGVLHGEKLVRELVVERDGGLVRLRQSSYQDLFSSEWTVPAADVAGLRLENHLAESVTTVRWDEAGRMIRERRWLDPGVPDPETERQVEERLAVRSPVLRLTVRSGAGATHSFLLRVQDVEKAAQIQELLERIAAALGLADVRLLWSDRRKVIVAAGEPAPGEEAAVAKDSPSPRFSISSTSSMSSASATSEDSLPDRLPPVEEGMTAGRYTVRRWDPPRRIVIRRGWGKIFLIWLWPIGLMAGLPVIELIVRDAWHRGLPGDPLFSWAVSAFWIAFCAVAFLVHAGLESPRTQEIDWVEGVARRRGALRRKTLVLSRVRAVLLEEKPPVDRYEDPYKFCLDLVPDEAAGGPPLRLVEVETLSDRRREELHRRLAPLAVGLAAALDVPCRMTEPGDWFAGL